MRGFPLETRGQPPKRSGAAGSCAGKARRSRQGPAGAGEGCLPEDAGGPGKGMKVKCSEQGRAHSLGSCALTAVLPTACTTLCAGLFVYPFASELLEGASTPAFIRENTEA